jgi:hypothetical protein
MYTHCHCSCLSVLRQALVSAMTELLRMPGAAGAITGGAEAAAGQHVPLPAALASSTRANAAAVTAMGRQAAGSGTAATGTLALGRKGLEQ